MRFVTGFCVLFAVLMMTGPISAQSLESDFLGVSWGDDIRDQAGYELLYAKGDLRYYIQPETARVVKGFTIARVIYGTYQHRFYAAFLMIDAMETFDDIKAYMEERYGFPKISWSAAGEQTVYKWTYKAIRMKLKFYQKDRQMKLAFYYSPIADQVNEQEAEASQQKSLQFFPVERDKRPETMPLLVF